MCVCGGKSCPLALIRKHVSTEVLGLEDFGDEMFVTCWRYRENPTG